MHARDIDGTSALHAKAGVTWKGFQLSSKPLACYSVTCWDYCYRVRGTFGLVCGDWHRRGLDGHELSALGNAGAELFKLYSAGSSGQL